jgi:hypothetical protein
MRKKPREKLPKTRWRKSRLEELVERAVAGASGDEEEQLGFFTAIEEQLRFPFRTRLPDGEVKVLGIEAGEDDEIVAVCLRDGERQEVPLLDLPLPKPPPRGAEWIEAYRLWVSE